MALEGHAMPGMNEHPFEALGIITGMLIVLYGLRLWRRARQRVARSIRVRGRIVSVEKTDDDGGHTWFPTIAYEVNGKVYSVVGYGEDREPTIGKKVKVRYTPDDPAAGWTEESLGPYLWPILTIAVGAMIIATVLAGLLG